MRVIILLLVMSLAAEPAQSQVLPAPAKPRGERASDSTLRDAKELTDCENRWVAATHMTKKQWLQTCRRVLDRLRLLDLRGGAR
jgi:hypothetical protein